MCNQGHDRAPPLPDNGAATLGRVGENGETTPRHGDKNRTSCRLLAVHGGRWSLTHYRDPLGIPSAARPSPLPRCTFLGAWGPGRGWLDLATSASNMRAVFGKGNVRVVKTGPYVPLFPQRQLVVGTKVVDQQLLDSKYG